MHFNLKLCNLYIVLFLLVMKIMITHKNHLREFKLYLQITRENIKENWKHILMENKI